jgi:hypothetical protein
MGEGPWGHAAILLDDGTYISWWPTSAENPDNTQYFNDERGHWARDARDPSYAADVQKGQEGEGRGPDVDIYINWLDEAAIKKWWNEYRKNKRWDTHNRNCSHTVMDALKAGGAGSMVNSPKPFMGPMRPSYVEDYARSLQMYNNVTWP